MNDAIAGSTATWIARVLGTIDGYMTDREYVSPDSLANLLRSTPWWEGCPRLDSAGEIIRRREFRRVPLASGNGYSALLIAWPPGHQTPVHDHDDLWGIELVLDGVLAVETYIVQNESPLRLRCEGTAILGMGDHAAFVGRRHVHRCRNLSERKSSLSLHVYGGELESYRAFEEYPAGQWHSDRCAAQRARTFH